MIIECTRCQTRAKIPDSKEGAKVRCPECGHVYVAGMGAGRAGGARQKKEDPTKYFIIGGVIVVAAVLMIMVSKGGKEKAPDKVVEAAAEPEGALVPVTGFDSAPVVAARKIHDAVWAGQTTPLLTSIDFDAVHAWQASLAEVEVAEGAEPPTPVLSHRSSFSGLTPSEQNTYRYKVIDELTTGQWQDLVREWKPLDGDIVSETSTSAVVRVRVAPRDTSLILADRHVEWHLIAVPGKANTYMAQRWERYISDAEKQAEKQASTVKSVKTTLSDGREAVEAEVSAESITWHPDTPQEIRDEVDQLCNVLINLESGRSEMSAARDRLAEIGKHAVPGLLLKMAEIAPDPGPPGTTPPGFPVDHEIGMQLNLLGVEITNITEWTTTFSVIDPSAEGQASGLRQWFGLFRRKYKKFYRDYGTALGSDPFLDDPDFKARNAKEQKEFDDARRKAGGGN